MKKLSTSIILMLITLHLCSQTIITASAGASLTKGAVVELQAGHSMNGHSIALIGVAHLSDRQPEYGGIIYSYTFAGVIQPYIGYGYQKWTSDHKSPENAWKAAYGLQVNWQLVEDAPAALCVNLGGIGNEVLLTAGLNLKL